MINPIEFCQRQRGRFLAESTPQRRKEQGQFFTPPEVAQFMAQLSPMRRRNIRLVDPGAGAGMLTCAVCEKVAMGRAVREIHVDAYEDDPFLAELLNETFEYTQDWMRQKGVEFDFHIIQEDFLLANAGKPLRREFETFDIAIANPPYFKIGKGDPRAANLSELVFGQPNIYALFMGVTVRLLREGGVLVFITPRSYSAGVYFKAFRNYFFSRMFPERVHIFESRKEAFKKDDVLQENIILKAIKGGVNEVVGITSSQGSSDLVKRRRRIYRIPINTVLHGIDNDVIFRLPKDERDTHVLNIVDNWEGRLNAYNMEISTGPVVTFRAEELIPQNGREHNNCVPLLWMHNVRPMSVVWPIRNNGKRQYIIDNDESRRRKLLVSNQNMVLLRRFSAKEEVRRLVAAPFIASQLNFDVIGLENHLNYIYRQEGDMTEQEVIGLAALLNSSLLDQYFRISNGNTQVSATELRAMPMPPLPDIQEIGGIVQDVGEPNLTNIDEIVMRVLDL